MRVLKECSAWPKTSACPPPSAPGRAGLSSPSTAMAAPKGTGTMRPRGRRLEKRASPEPIPSREARRCPSSPACLPRALQACRQPGGGPTRPFWGSPPPARAARAPADTGCSRRCLPRPGSSSVPSKRPEASPAVEPHRPSSPQSKLGSCEVMTVLLSALTSFFNLFPKCVSRFSNTQPAGFMPTASRSSWTPSDLRKQRTVSTSGPRVLTGLFRTEGDSSHGARTRGCLSPPVQLTRGWLQMS